MMVTVFDDAGPVCTIPARLAERDVQRGLIAPTDNERVFTLNASKVAALNLITENARRKRKHGRFA